jgi:hypothetical protein
VTEAVRVYSDIEEAAAQVNETRELAEKLLKVIDAPNRMDLFPALQEGRARSLALENALMSVLGQSADLEFRALGAAAEQPDAAGYRLAHSARVDLQRKMVSMPSTEADMAARLERFRERLAELEKRIFRQQLDIDRVQSTIAAIDTNVQDKKTTGSMSAAEEEYWRNELVQLRGALEQMRDLEKELKGAMRQERETLTLANVQGSQEGLIRQQYRDAVRREAAAARPLTSQGNPQLASQLPEVARARDGADRMLARLDAFNSALRSQVDAQASEMRGIVMLERSRVSEYENMTGAYQGEAREMAAVLTAQALKGVRDQFYDVVLRADVGLIDLAWQSKQEKTDEVSRLVRRQKTDILQLDEEFQEVLRDIE